MELGIPAQADPHTGPVPDRIRGFRVRVDLVGASPPVWRRLELPGDLPLDDLHHVLQAAMGWFDGHLHRFRTGSDHRSPSFVTPFDIEEGEAGMLEGDVRLDQLLTSAGDRLWYEYDFGDGWDHVIAVEAVLDEPPTEVRCTGGRMACPPEDCGGIGGYAELAAWVRQGSLPSSVPDPFDDAEQALQWLPPGWHPDRFDVEEANAALAGALAAPVPGPQELADLCSRLAQVGDPRLTQLVARPAPHPQPEMSEGDAARLIEPFTTLLDVVGDGVRLTGAGYLPPTVVEQLAERLGVTEWWIGKANREDLTAPIAGLRESARSLGLLSVRKGRLAPTAAARKNRERPVELWRHIVSRLPLGRTDFDRHAGWVALVVAASDVPVEDWTSETWSVLSAIWRVEGPWPELALMGNPTLGVLNLLSGSARQSRLSGVDPAVVATARAVIHAPVLGP